MIHLYTAPSCTSCQKAKRWLEDHNLEYQLHHLLYEPLSDREIKHILYLSEEGIDSLLSPHTKAYQNIAAQIELFSLSEMFDLIRKEPTMIRKPILFDEKRLVIGYNEEEIRCFLPKEESRRAMRKLEELLFLIDQENG